LNFVTPKRHFLARNRVIWATCVKISSVVFPVEDGKKKRKGKERHKKSRKRYISPVWGKAPRKLIFTKFCISGDMLGVIICVNFGVEKLRGLGNTRGQILEFPIEMAGHLYNRAGATAQPVINNQNSRAVWIRWLGLDFKEFRFCLSNAMHCIGQSIKPPERPCVRAFVQHLRRHYLDNGAR